MFEKILSEELRRQNQKSNSIENIKHVAPPIVQPKLTERKTTKSKKQLAEEWIQMKSPEITPEIRNDLKYLEIRKYTSKKHFYKSSGIKGIPSQFQVGTIIEGPGEFYTGRIPKKQRKQSILEEMYESRDAKDRYKTAKPKSAKPPHKTKLNRSSFKSTKT